MVPCGLLLIFVNVFAVLAISLPASAADIVELRGGGQIEGAVKRMEQQRAPYVVVQVDTKIRIAIPESQVARVAESAEREEYRQRAKEIKESADEHFEFARWCKSKQLTAQYRYHLQRAIAIDPEHDKARAGLGYAKNGEQWIRNAQFLKLRGMISVAGQIRLPEEVALKDAQEEATVAIKKWNLEVARLRTGSLRGGDRSAEFMAKLAAIDDPHAAHAMAHELLDLGKQQPQSLRLFWLERLAFFKNRPAVEALVKTGLSDNDMIVQEKALEALKMISPSTAIAKYLPLLKSNDNATVRRAAVALSYFPDPELALPLIDALVTEHKHTIAPGQALNPSFSSNGSSGLSAGGKPVVKIDNIENPQVLALLRQIQPDADFGYDKVRWRQYLASRLSSFNGNMRRDP